MTIFYLFSFIACDEVGKTVEAVKVANEVEKKAKDAVNKLLDPKIEVINNLNSIRRAEKNYEREYDVFHKVSPYPENPTINNGFGIVFIQEESEGFKTINWKPASPNVRGSYSVSTTSSDFVAEGVIDVNDDGIFETYRATKDKSAYLVEE